MFDQQPTQLTEEIPEERSASQDIRVMPEKFLRPEKKIKIPRFIWIGFGVLILAGLATVTVLWQQGLLFQPAKKPLIEKKPMVVEKSTPPKEAEEPVKPVFPLTSPAQTLEEEIKDEQDNLISSAKLILPEGSIDPVEAKIFLSGSLPGPEEKDHPQYQIIGGVYRIKSKDLVNFLKPVELILKYNQKVLEEYGVDEVELELISLREEGWQIEEAELDTQEKNLKIILEKFSPLPYALVVAREKIKQKLDTEIIAETTLPSSLDSDKDGLTDEEEVLYKTRKDLVDTDQDSYPDGLEIVNLYSPLSGPGDRLTLSGLVNSYTNPVYNYTLFYPSSWLAKAVDETNREVIFTAQTGEFIEVIIQENPRKLLILDWYLEKSPDLKASEIRIINLDGQQAAWSPNGQAIYLAKDDKIYGLIYNSGIREDLNFKATFGMMIKSFRVIEETTLPETEEVAED